MNVTPLRYAPAQIESADRAHGITDLLPTYIDLAERIANTEFVPTSLRRRPEAVLAALMSGAERGLGPMESLRSIHVIEGKPTLSAEVMRALVLAAGHEIEIVETNAQRATVVGRRAGSTSTSPPFTWTMDRARRARLVNKDVWQKYPEAMLLARASTDLCRAVFPDVIAGLASTEEVIDEVVTPESTSSRRRPPVRSRPLEQTTAAGAASAPALASAAAPIAPAALAHSGEIVDAAESRPSAASAPIADFDDLLDDDIDSAEPEPSQRPPEPSQGHDPAVARRLHAEITKAFPEADTETRDRYRHALCAVITRKRPDGPVTSSSDLTLEEQLFVSDLLARIMGGSASMADGPDDTIELRAGGGWIYTITLDPLTVAVRRGEVAPNEEVDDG